MVLRALCCVNLRLGYHTTSFIAFLLSADIPCLLISPHRTGRSMPDTQLYTSSSPFFLWGFKGVAQSRVGEEVELEGWGRTWSGWMRKGNRWMVEEGQGLDRREDKSG
ncbi:hypothetical protein E2C01_047294 [Portunus trituberculatus]|uniref:Uncharacterized protein n=1 Tax=Portunus trituberculatus TaxID=210409 RepID=A0A5B7GA33_PORTR|nr:hypothetical protein [Portunus trituberculatus]